MDGRTDGYTDEQEKELKTWLTAQGLTRMKDHLLKEILQYRYADRLRFKGSQLEKIFNELKANADLVFEDLYEDLSDDEAFLAQFDISLKGLI